MHVTIRMATVALVMGWSVRDPDQTGWTRIAVEDKMVSITFDQAEDIARKYLKQWPEFDFIIVESATEEYQFGWVFRYLRRKFLETGDSEYAVFGSTSFIVNREGAIYKLPFGSGARDIESYLKKWLATHPH